MRHRVDDALLKEMLGEPLSHRELAIVQWVRHGGGCGSCSGGSNDGSAASGADDAAGLGFR